MEMKINHDHPLILIKNVRELRCPKCDQHLDESYRCKCHSSSYKCLLCNDDASGSCYTFEQYWKDPMQDLELPLVHQSCFELKEEIEIAYRPHCVLVFGQKDDARCDFCKRWKSSCKYICGDCNFKICFGCLSKLIKYHEGQKQVNHFIHRHPLTLLNLADMICEFCNEGIIDGEEEAYCCAPCKFCIHISCRDKLLPEIEHPFHPNHSLTFKDYANAMVRRGCGACPDVVESAGYGCDKCDFVLHLKCTALKANIKYEGHPHLLILMDKLDYKRECEACGFDFEDVFFMRCMECSLDFHVQCDPDHPLPPTVWHKEHEHPLIIHINEALEKDDCQLLSCNVCGKEMNPDGDPFSFYRCAADCEYIAHVRCAITEVQCEDARAKQRHSNDKPEFEFHPLPLTVLHKEHEHPLTHSSMVLVMDEYQLFSCNICGKEMNPKDPFYLCADCKYIAHVGCPITEVQCDTSEKQKQSSDKSDLESDPDQSTSLKANIEYKGHQHLLTLVENNMSSGHECEACGCDIQGGVFYLSCEKCYVFFHVQCGPLPLPSILYEAHSHPLTLSTKRLAKVNSSQLRCGACTRDINPEHQIYYCVECDYHAHMRCVITTTKLPLVEIESIKHVSHQHSLFLFENKRNNISCVGCGESIQPSSSSPAFGCDQCEFYLHKSCAELPREIQHPFHQHTLSLPSPYYSGILRECNGCGKPHYGLVYGCERCEFYLDLDCSSIFPSTKLVSYHPHTLTFFEKLDDNLNCHRESECVVIGQNKSTPLDHWYLRCVPCNFSLHFLCCQLPTSFKHDSHPQHSLNLKDNFGDLFVDDFEDEEYCCDFCEKRREARECVYHCEECSFVVDLQCLFSEMIKFLEGKRKDGEFITVSRKIISKKVKGLTYDSILESITEEEEKLTDPLIQVKEMINEGTLEDIFDDLKAVNRTVKMGISTMLDELNEDGNGLDEELKMWLKFFKLGAHAELVSVGDYKINSMLAPILHKFLEEHGDFVAGCSLTQRLKTLLLTTLCGVMQEMRMTPVKRIGREGMVSWWIQLKLVQRAGFRIEFALEHFKTMAAGYFLIRDTGFIHSDPLYESHEEIAQLTKEVDQRKARIEKLNKEVLGKVSRHDSNKQSRDTAIRFNEALGSWWKNAAYPLLDDIPES